MAGGLRQKLAARLKRKSAAKDEKAPPPYVNPPEYKDIGITETEIVSHFVKSLHIAFLTDNYEILVKERCGETGGWALEAPPYLQWRSEPQSTFLWSSGKPGAGKSVISAMLAKHLRDDIDTTPKPHVGLACIFLDYNSVEKERDVPLLVVKSLISQLGSSSVRADQFPAELRKLSSLQKPGYEDYVAALQEVVSQLKTANIVIDALDECERDDQVQILSLVEQLLLPCKDSLRDVQDGVDREPNTVHILLSSRRNDIIEAHREMLVSKSTLVSTFELEVRATDQDIETYVTQTLSAHERHLKQDRKPTPLLEDQTLRKEVIQTLVDQAAGMFLWVKLQTSLLKDLRDHSSIQDFLHNLPISEDIERTYVQMLHKIQSQSPRERKLAQRALLWVTYAIRPIVPQELYEAVEIDEPAASPSGTNSSIEAYCANFLEISSSDGVKFVHYTAKEFFRRTGKNLVHKYMDGSTEFDSFFPGSLEGNLQLGKWCVSYLITSFGKEKATHAIESPAWFLITNQFAHYACVHFDQHLYRAEEALDGDAISVTEKFLGSKGGILEGFMLIRNMESIWDLQGFEEMKFWPGNTTRDTVIRATALQRISQFAIPPAESIDAEIERNRWILHHAAFSGDTELVESILKNVAPETGFLIQKDTRGATALYYAARQGYLDICTRLLDIGQVPPDAGHVQSNPLQVAALNGHLDVVKLLLEGGADANLKGGLYNTALQAASWNGHYGVVDELLKRDRDKVSINAVADSGTPRTYCALQAAAYRGHDAIVRRLLEHGADVDLEEPYESQFGLPLQAAIHGGHLSTARILLDAGADVSAVSGMTESGGTALIAAAAGGNDAAVRLLIEQGAIVAPPSSSQRKSDDVNRNEDNEEDEEDTTDDEEGSDFSIDSDEWEDDFSDEDDILDGDMALHWALARGHFEVVNTLLSYGASLSRVKGKYGNAVQAAVVGCNERLVRKALDVGIDVNAPGGYFLTSLIAAAKEGNPNIVKMLLDAGADMRPIDRNYGNALDAACYPRHFDIAELLIDRGASVKNALPEIASTANVDLARKVIELGVDVNASCRSPYKTALQAAAWGGQAEMVQLFLSYGANPNYVGGVYGTALHAAISSGSLEAVKHLVAAGADVNSPFGKDPRGVPLQAACLKIDEKLVRYLLDHGAKVNLDSPCGDYGSALQAAVTTNWEPIVKILLDAGADVNAKGGIYGSPLNAAKEVGNEDMVRLLTR